MKIEIKMNKTLAIHIEEDFLIAGVEPVHGKFFNLTKRGNNRFFFYFFIDTINNKIDYSEIYKENFFNNELNYIGNFLKIFPDKTFYLNSYENDFIELLNPIMSDLRQVYFSIMSSFFKELDLNETDEIPLKISYSDSLMPDKQPLLEEYFVRNRFQIISTHSDFSLQFGKEYLRKNLIDFKNKKVAFLEALASDLKMFVVQYYNAFEAEIVQKEIFYNFGLDPRNFILAKKIVDDINKQEGLLVTDQELKQEYIRQMPLAKKWIDKLDSHPLPYFRIETNFGREISKKHFINISVEELNQLTYSHIRQIGRYFETHFLVKNNLSVNEFDKILLLGDSLCNKLVENEFVRFGKSKIEHLHSSEISMVLRNMLFIEPIQSIENQLTDKSKVELHEVEFINIENLKIGQTVKLTNFDATPGKGEAIQEFNYLGNKQFVVVFSTRSLKKGDTAEALADVWMPSMQVDLRITQNGKFLGLFRTRKIVKIEIS